ncbi:MAG: hypothetical protein M5U31_16255 [Acidimicrobiia bacterium]|nr:hypothetical protein [Acidimicrobiia bacterium]
MELRGALENSGLDARDVELLLVASTPRLRLAEIVWQFPLDALDELPPYEEIAAPTKRPAPLQTPFGGCRLDLYLDLVRELAEAPLRPWRKGNLARPGRVSDRDPAGRHRFPAGSP